MLVKTVLNKVEHFKRFIFQKVLWEIVQGKEALVVDVAARKGSKPRCSRCEQPVVSNGRLDERLFQFVPLWGIAVYFRYRPRRVLCPIDGSVVEHLPWASGKERLTKTFKVFLAQWARRLSWQETARVFDTSWDSVVSAIRYVVDYGLKHRSLEGITQLGVDEIAVRKGQNGYLTLVYQLDQGTRRLLWIGRDRTTETLARFFGFFGEDRTRKVQFICSDMWKPYLKAIREHASQALNILDRFHVMKNMNEALDNVRKGEMRALGKEARGNRLYRGRWALLKNPENLTEAQAAKLGDLLKANLKTVKAYLMKEDLKNFWGFLTAINGQQFLRGWIKRARKTRIKPMHWMARKLEKHEALLLNYFEAKGGLALGAVEGLNLKAKLILRKSYGFKSLDNIELALYHGLGRLPEPPTIHRFG